MRPWCVPRARAVAARGTNSAEIRLPDIVFTEQRIAALPLPAKGEVNYRDPSVPGLGVRCRPGSKSYIVRYRIGGRASPSVRLTLGAAGSGGIPLGEAKKIAARIAADVAHGRDPLAEQRAAIEAAKIAERRMTLGRSSDGAWTRTARSRRSECQQRGPNVEGGPGRRARRRA